ncbi:hypothetical protein ACOMHN_036574 [Nucella lapillus]
MYLVLLKCDYVAKTWMVCLSLYMRYLSPVLSYEIWKYRDPAVALEVIGHDVTQGRLHVLRTSGRQGLVRARLLGAKAARGRVLVFLDSHCECGPHWITPLLVALRHDKHKVVSPYIDVIRSESFAFARSPDNLQGDFNWRLEFGWRAIAADQLTSREGPHIPIRTPVISGGLFAVYRDFFFNIGAYDDHMDIWGGENMELSFRSCFPWISFCPLPLLLWDNGLSPLQASKSHGYPL